MAGVSRAPTLSIHKRAKPSGRRLVGSPLVRIWPRIAQSQPIVRAQARRAGVRGRNPPGAALGRTRSGRGVVGTPRGLAAALVHVQSRHLGALDDDEPGLAPGSVGHPVPRWRMTAGSWAGAPARVARRDDRKPREPVDRIDRDAHALIGARGRGRRWQDPREPAAGAATPQGHPRARVRRSLPSRPSG